MKSQRLEIINEVFQRAVDLPSEERLKYLSAACAGDDKLRAEVDSLLAAHKEAGSFMKDAASNVAAAWLRNDKQHPSQLGQYKIERLLGSGGMGEVYLATDRMGRKVALKLLAHRYGEDRVHVARFKQEAQTVLALNHPNVVTLYDIGQVDFTYYIASELIEGETLRQRLDKAELQLMEVLEIGIQIANALVAAHEKGIIHRDIKPENVMIRADGYVKVLDFGIAKLMEGQVSPTPDEAPTVIKVETQEGSVMGTAPYMSPEQARGLPVDSRTDIWSFGVLLYESITGRKPFWGETAPDVMAAILKSEPAPLSKLQPEAPAEVERIVRKTLAKAPDERYQTAKDLLVDLRQLRRQQEIESELARSAPPGKSDINPGTGVVAARPTSNAAYLTTRIREHRLGYTLAALLILSLVGIFLGYRFLGSRSSNPVSIESIAVLPFVNESGSSDVEYLSDGMTESLINSLSVLPRLSVKARSTVFRYKGKQIEPQKVSAELSVQAILNGRVVQRGDDLTLYLSLVDGRTGNQIWGEQYNRKLNDLVTLQSEIARDVSRRVQARLSGADERKLSRGYGTNTEAYQLYLKGRYHFVRLTAPELENAASYFQKAIDIDPGYAAAYAGLSQVYRARTLSGELPANDLLPKAKLMAQKAVALDDELGDAHAALGIVTFFYDWKLDQAENEFKRALELDPNNSDTHQFYAIMLTGAGRHSEAIAEIKRALELDPLNVLANAQEAQIFLYAGRYDDALASTNRAFELEPNYWFAHFWASAAYIEKGMYAEAVAEASKSRKVLRVGTHQTGLLAYALAKWGKRAEARAELDEVLQLSARQYVSAYNVAWIYNGLDEREQTFVWLERAYQQRDPKIVVLKVDPKWKNLRGDGRFQDLLRRVGFTP